MASKYAVDEASSDSGLECVICLHTFDLKDHLPMSLGCGHSLCHSCLTKLTEGSTVKCPTCRQNSDLLSDVTTNYALNDFLEKFCPGCRQQKPKDQCPHCTQRVCLDCCLDHVRRYAGNVDSKGQDVSGEIELAQKLSRQKLSEAQTQKRESAIAELKSVVSNRIETLRRFEKELERKLHQRTESNITQLRKWKSELIEKSSEAAAYINSSENGLREDSIKISDFADIKTIDDRLDKFQAELKNLTSGPPPATEYRFLASQRVLSLQDVGEIVGKERPPLLTKPSVYSKMRFESMTGSKGSGTDRFDQPAGVVCTDTSIFVTDRNNHRVKQLDYDLQPVTTFGHKRFKPDSITVGQRVELFISDKLNHRVEVMDTSGITVRKFGRRGSGQAELSEPMGMATTTTGELVICEGSRLQVLTADGRHIRMIGDEGPGRFDQFPLRVAITKTNTILATEINCRTLKQFSLDGEFLGPWPPSVPDVFKDAHPLAVCVDPVDSSVLVSYDSQKIGVYTKHGTLVCTLGGPGTGAGEFHGISGLALTKDRDLIVCDAFNHRIQKFSFQQAVLEK